MAIDIDIANLIVQAVIGAATVGTLIVALCQISQNKKERKADIEQHQAALISVWYEKDQGRNDQPKNNRFVWQLVALRNESESPVYDMIVTCVGISGAGPLSKGEENRPDFPCRICVGTLPPGLWYTWLPTEGSGMHVRTAPEAAFTDANGISWVRRGNGKLEKAALEPAAFYKLPLPLEWHGCEGSAE